MKMMQTGWKEEETGRTFRWTKNAKRWLSALLMTVLLAQSLPLQALADQGSLLTDSEMRRAMMLAGLETAEDSSEERLSLTFSDSGYHEGMKPGKTWDVPMLSSWLENMYEKRLYNLTLQYNEVLTVLDRKKESDPATYARLMESADAAGSLARCRQMASSAVLPNPLLAVMNSARWGLNSFSSASWERASSSRRPKKCCGFPPKAGVKGLFRGMAGSFVCSEGPWQWEAS